MTGAAICAGNIVTVRQQPVADNGDIIPGDTATILGKIVCVIRAR